MNRAAKASTNGKALPTSAPEAMQSAEHFGRFFDVSKERDRAWMIAKGLLALCVLLAVSLWFAIASSNPRVAVREVDRNTGDVTVVDDAKRVVTSQENTIEHTILIFIVNMREVLPGSDYAFIDARTKIVHRELTQPNSDAERSELAYWQSHNPKDAARSFTRHVFQYDSPYPPTFEKVAGLTWTVQWYEQTRSAVDGTLSPIKHRGGYVTLASEPLMSADNEATLANPGGIKITSYGLPDD